VEAVPVSIFKFLLDVDSVSCCRVEEKRGKAINGKMYLKGAGQLPVSTCQLGSLAPL